MCLTTNLPFRTGVRSLGFSFPFVPQSRRRIMRAAHLLWNTGIFIFISGAPMPRYLTQRMQAGGTARAERVLVNMLEGKMFVEFRADSREALEGWLKTEAMHFDWLVRIEWEMQGHKLQPAN